MLERLGREMVDYTIEMIILHDEEGNIHFANQIASMELEYAEGLENVNIKRILRQELTGEGEEKKFDVSDFFFASETFLYRGNESCFPALIKITPSQSVPGQYLLAGINMTKKQEGERRLLQMKEELEAALKTRNEFVANVTHELRTPLNGIRGHLSTLQETELTAEQKRTTEIIMQCCTHMSSIIDNILDFSKLEAGKFIIEENEFKFREMLNHVIDMNIAVINEKGLHLVVNVAEDIPEKVVGDQLRISQVLNNLFSNAVKFTSVGYISMEVTKTLEFDNEIELFFMVRDTGIGISREDQDKLFKSFSQVDASITRKYGGTGLGLAITKHLVELMGGSISLQSRKGEGSTFSFSLRLKNVAAQEAEESGEQESMFLFRQSNADTIKYDSMEKYFTFGTSENVQELRNNLEKLVICLELGTWERAEAFAGNLKSLLQKREDLKKKVFRLEMSLRKEDYEKSMQQYSELKEILEQEVGGM